jgi:hypothetical protein
MWVWGRVEKFCVKDEKLKTVLKCLQISQDHMNARRGPRRLILQLDRHGRPAHVTVQAAMIQEVINAPVNARTFL